MSILLVNEVAMPELSALRTLASNLAQEVDDCCQALSTLKEKLLARVGMRSLLQIERIANLIDRRGMEFPLCSNDSLC